MRRHWLRSVEMVRRSPFVCGMVRLSKNDPAGIGLGDPPDAPAGPSEIGGAPGSRHGAIPHGEGSLPTAVSVTLSSAAAGSPGRSGGRAARGQVAEDGTRLPDRVGDLGGQGPGVVHPGDLVLAAELAAAPHPVGEAAGADRPAGRASAGRPPRRGGPGSRRSGRQRSASRARRKASGSDGGSPNSTRKRWWPRSPSKTGPACQSRTAAPVAVGRGGHRRLDLLADQVLAEGRERVLRPAGEASSGAASSDSNRTVSPTTCDQSPAQVVTTIA